MSLCLSLKSLCKLAGLELGRRAVEDVEGFDAIVYHAESSVEKTHKMWGGFAGFWHELLAIGADGDEEGVDAHRTRRCQLWAVSTFMGTHTHPVRD
jgi:hypothetical protein